MKYSLAISLLSSTLVITLLRYGEAYFFSYQTPKTSSTFPPKIFSVPFRFEEENIAPGFFPKPPKQYLNLTFPIGMYGNFNTYVMYTTAELKKPPISVHWVCLDNSTYYTLFFTNLEEVHELKWWNTTEHHTHWWLLVNIHHCDFKTGEVIIPYKAPKKRPEIGMHRMVFFLYEQPGKLSVNISEFAKPEVDIRESFSIHDFVNKYKLGDLEAGNFFRYYGTEWQNMSDSVHL